MSLGLGLGLGVGVEGRVFLPLTTFTIWMRCGEVGGVSGPIFLKCAGLNGLSSFGAGGGGRGVIWVLLPRDEEWEGLVWFSIARSSGVVRPARRLLEWF